MVSPVRRSQNGSSSDTQMLILRAALREFSQKGFDGSTAREIANRAGVNHGLIRYYFGSKEKLWRAAVDLAFAELHAGLGVIEQDPAALGEEQRIRLLIRGFVHYVARRPEFVRLMHEEGKRKGPRMRWMVDHHVKPLYESMTLLLEQAQAKGLFPTTIAPIHFHYILAGAAGVIFHQAEECRRLIGTDPFDDAMVEAHARAVEQLFLGPGEPAANP